MSAEQSTGSQGEAEAQTPDAAPAAEETAPPAPPQDAAPVPPQEDAPPPQDAAPVPPEEDAPPPPAAGVEPPPAPASEAEESPAAGAAAAGGAPEEPVPEDIAAEEERRIRQELGIHPGKIDLDSEQIDRLLDEAQQGYQEVFGEERAAGGDGPASGEGAAVSATAGAPTAAADPVEENLSLLKDVHLKVKVELGRGRMYLKDLLRLGQGSVVELEKLAGDPLDIYVNEKVVARGEVLVLNENFCIRITEIFHPEEALR